MIKIVGVMVGAGLLAATIQSFAGLRVDTMLCEHLENPCGLDVTQPNLTWTLSGDSRAEYQSAYQVLVAKTREALDAGHGDLWDSGKVLSDATTEIGYAGERLLSREQCFWKVRVWNRQGKVSDWSPAASWEMGLLQPGDWNARWIGRTTNINIRVLPLLRREFTLAGEIKSARAYICGLGHYELFLNGRKVGNHLLDPAFTDYDRRVLYVTYDVTELLRPGTNAVGVLLGNARYNSQNKTSWQWEQAPWRAAPKMILQVEVEFKDGRRKTIVSDRNWKCADSPTLSDLSYSGEVYDARREQPGWNRAGFDDSSWDPALVVAPPGGRLVAQVMPAVELDQTLNAARITEPEEGVFVFDFGQNMAGRALLKVRGPAGSKVTMKYGERLNDNGLVDQRAIAEHTLRMDSNQTFQTDGYILKGGKETEQWHSKFTYDGFQYVEMRGFPGRPTAENLRAEVIHTAVPVAGTFDCSNPLLNKIWEATRWSYLNNLEGIPSDCPQREKNGWTGDAHLAAEQAMFNYFPVSVYSKWMNDIADAQKPDGSLPGIVPSGGWGYDEKGAAWDSAFLLIPYYEYLYFGDTEDLRRHYDRLKRYVDYLGGKAKNGILTTHSLADWEHWNTETRAALIETGYYYVDARIVALAAGLLHKEADVSKYSDLAQNIRMAFNQEYFDPKTGSYDNGSQTALSCALYQGLAESADRTMVLSNLVHAVASTGWHLDTGILGAKYVMNALLENGRPDVAYKIVAQKTQPGWGWWIEQGATTLWEGWGPGGSHDHVMFGDVSAWFYKALAGIRPDEDAPGFKHFFIEPNVVGDLTFAKAQYDSIRGRIVSDWKVGPDGFSLRVEIPANTSATVSLPADAAQGVWEGTKPLASAKGISRIRVEAGRIAFETASGQYFFHLSKTIVARQR